MSFEIVDIAYAPDRKMPKVNKIVASNPDDPTRLNFAYSPVPYDINVELSIMTKNADDGTQIVEQILPYFTPDFTATINVLPELDVKYDIPIVLNSVNYTDSYEGDFINRRAIIWSLNFTIKGYIFGATSKNRGDGKIISLANTAVFANVFAPSPVEAVTVEPGLLANGAPTTNAAASIDRSLISANSNYGFINDFIGIFEE
jgi:hypothetical protein